MQAGKIVMGVGGLLLLFGYLKSRKKATTVPGNDYLDLPTTYHEVTPGNFVPPRNPFANWGQNPDDYTNVITIPTNAPQTNSSAFGDFINF